MNCNLYSALTSAEQAEYIGKLVIAVQSDDSIFEYAKGLIKWAESKGIYDTTKLHADAAALSDVDNKIENGITTHT